MAPSAPIFFDPSGKRRQIARLILFASLALCIAAAIVTEVIFWASPLVSRQALDKRSETKPLTEVGNVELSREAIKRSRDALVREIQESHALVRVEKNSNTLGRKAAYVDGVNENVLSLIRAHAGSLTEISSASLSLAGENDSPSGIIVGRETGPWHAELRAVSQELSLPLVPRLTAVKSTSDIFVPLRNPKNRSLVANELASLLEREEFPAVLIDLYPSIASDVPTYAAFVEAVSQACHLIQKEVRVISYIDDAVGADTLARVADSVVLVNLFRNSRKGSLSSITSFGDRLQSLQKAFSADRISVALSAQAIKQHAGNMEQPERITFSDAMLRDESATLEFDPPSGTSFYRFVDDDGTKGTVWLIDAAFSYNSKKLAESGAIASFGVWNIGGEDAGLWELLAATPSIAELSHVSPTSPLVSHGRGDVMSVSLSGVAEGGRRLQIDEQTGLITRVTYESIPTAPTTLHSGYQSKKIALTFDDGPAEPFTADLLDLLKAQGVKATFFVIGEHVLEYPNLVRRIYNEGHDIGNHSFSHPDLSLVSRHRVTLELNAAQRALQAVLGRSVLLFRPPYVSEDSPLSSQEFRVLSIAQELGYSTVGISNNGRDWVRYEEGPDGSELERSGQAIANEILAKVDTMSGNSILLHDGPKERERSVEAVRILIPKLRERDYSFATIHELMGVPRESLFPIVAHSRIQVVHRTILELISNGSYVFSAIFVVLVVLGIIRLALILICAVLAKIKELGDTHTPEELDKARDLPVSIVIAAYNEEKVIAHTLESLLRGNHRVFEIIVVDDGSKDGTSTVVKERFGNESRIRLVQQSNAGKSAALNHGIRLAKHDILVCLDADTQFDRDAVTYLARHFFDSSVGAVAGNIKVGNRRSILTHWQSMEYITNISIGRRAYSYLNAIMVVAGAAGAWRRSALEQAGGYHSDSLAEDMDLTWRVRRLEWEVLNEPLAIGYTEAPEDFQGLYKQRFRWSYGALQCIWKHRSAIGKHGFFGWLGIPSIILFGSLFELFAPLADLKMLFAIISGLSIAFSGHPIHPGSLEYDSLVSPLITTVWLYVIFFGVELMISVLAFRLDGEDMRPLWLLFFQRFIYRQLMYIVACRAMWKAIIGWRQGWGTLQRTGTVSLPSA